MSDTPNNEINRQEITENEVYAESKQPAVDFESSTVFGKPEELGTKQDKKSTPWTKRVVTVAVILAAAGLLTGGWFLVRHFLPETGGTSSGTVSAETINLFTADVENVTSLKITAGENTLNIQSVAALGDNAPEEADGDWIIEDISPSLTDSSLISYRVEDACELTAIREMEGEGNYGLDAPTMTLKLTVTDGDGYDLTVGSASPDGSGYYCAISTLADRVFLVEASKLSLFSADPLSFAETTVVEALTSNDVSADYFKGDSSSLNMFDSIQISGSKIDGTISLAMTNDDSKFNLYSLSSPITAFADETKVLELLSPLADGLSAVDAVSFDYKADKAKYGLDTPAYVAVYKIGDYTLKLQVSQTNTNGVCYLAVGDDPQAIYSSYNDMLPFEGLTVTGLYTPYPFFENIITVSDITVSGPDGEYEYELTHHDSDDKETNLEVTCNGKKVETSAFRTFYQDLVKLSAMSFTTEKQNGEAEVTITVKFLGEGAKDTVITLIRISDMRYHFSINGTPYGIGSTDGVKLILSDCAKLAANGNLE